MPRWHPISISGYHIREAGSTAQQELAFTLKDGLTYVEQAVERGLDVDDFAPRLSFFFNAQIDFFEEIAKFRAARRIWAREMRETFGAKNPRSWQMRFHSQTAGVSLTAQQPLNNIVRTAIEALAGGPRGDPVAAHQLLRRGTGTADRGGRHDRVRTQQMIAHETGVTNTPDPLGGSYFVEALTDEMEARAYEYFAKIDELGGMVQAVEAQLPPARDSGRLLLAAAGDRRGRADRRGRQQPRRDRRSADPDPARRPGPGRQAGRPPAGRPGARDGSAVERALAALRDDAAHEDRNLMGPLMECARAHASEGEIVEALQQVFGDYTETPVF